MGVSYQELRRVCQHPVSAGNDVAGLLFGDRLSLPLTKLFIDRRLSPDLATVGMLVTGLAGAVLQLFGPGLALLGALLLLLYYVLDCVDGEVARWRRVEHARWGYYEYLFHVLVKATTFLCLGFAVWRAHGLMVYVLAGALAAVGTLWLKILFLVPAYTFVGSVLQRHGSGTRPWSEYAAAAREQARAEAAAPPPDGKEVARVFRLRPDLVTLRALATNFDVGLALLVLAAALDLLTGGLPVAGLGASSFRALWVIWYGFVLPIDFLDYLQTFVRRREFDRRMVTLLARAHGFSLEAPASGDEPRAPDGTTEPTGTPATDDPEAGRSPAGERSTGRRA